MAALLFYSIAVPAVLFFGGLIAKLIDLFIW